MIPAFLPSDNPPEQNTEAVHIALGDNMPEWRNGRLCGINSLRWQFLSNREYCVQFVSSLI
jgi:hypothetical protein